MAESCSTVLSNARKRYGNSKEGKSKAMRAYQKCRQRGGTIKKKNVTPVRSHRRRKTKFFGISL